MQIEYDLNIYNQQSFLRIRSKNTPEYKTICLLNYVQTGDDYWRKEGPCNHDYLDITREKEIEDE